MPDVGYYAKRPRPEHRRYLKERLAGRPNISAVIEVDDFRFTITRWQQSDIHLFLTNIYTIGDADVLEILREAPETTCIVTTMTYNQYSPEAKALARERGVALFRSNEFLGAAYLDGDRFLDYVPARRR